MINPYPEPVTPLPWKRNEVPISGRDLDYIVRAANAFPHLVAALALAHQYVPDSEIIERALAIARGEQP